MARFLRETAGLGVFTCTACTALFIYLLTLAPDLTWAHFGQDGGELITASRTLGVPHPPGYPTYVVFGNLFSRLIPFGSIAYRYNLFSAVCIALSAGVIAHITKAETETKFFGKGIALGLTMAFAPLVWGQAVITEVYGLNLLMVSLVVWAVVSERDGFWVGVLWGLAVTTHLTSVLLGGMIIVAGIGRINFRRLASGFLLGLIPFLLVWLFGRGKSPVIWGDFSSVGGWWWVVSARVYREGFGRNTGLDWGLVMRQLSWVGWVGVVLGGMAAVRARNRVGLGLSASGLLYLIYVWGYDTVDSVVNLLPAVLLFVLVMGVEKRVRFWVWVLPLLAVGINFGAVNLHNEWDVRSKVDETWGQLPDEAIVLTTGDQFIFSLWYDQYVLGVREDVRVVDQNLFAFDWYRERLAGRYGELGGFEEDNLDFFRAVNERRFPICEVAIDSDVRCEKK